MGQKNDIVGRLFTILAFCQEKKIKHLASSQLEVKYERAKHMKGHSTKITNPVHGVGRISDMYIQEHGELAALSPCLDGKFF